MSKLFPLDALQPTPVEDPPDPKRLREWNLNRPRGVGLYGARLSRRGGVSPQASELELNIWIDPSEALADRPVETARYLELEQWNKSGLT